MTPPKWQGSPLMVKNLKNGPISNFDSSKEPSWCTESNAKNLSSLWSTVSEKKRKNPPIMTIFGDFGQKLIFFEVFLKNFRNSTLQRDEVFCIDFSASRRFLWATKNHYLTIFPIFHHKGGPLWFRGGKNLRQPINVVKKLKEISNKTNKNMTDRTCKY